jgi:hypothetical protein
VITVATLRTLLDYDPTTGSLSWRERPADMFPLRRLWKTWNSRYAGTPALATADNTGYRHGCIFSRKVYAHRVAVALLNDAWPDEVDHVNGDVADNRAVNLRAVSHRENAKNVKLRADNKSGVCGVFWNTRNQKWHAKIRVAGQDIELGQYGDLAAAAEARHHAAEQYGFHENHGKRRA